MRTQRPRLIGRRNRPCGRIDRRTVCHQRQHGGFACPRDAIAEYRECAEIRIGGDGRAAGFGCPASRSFRHYQIAVAESDGRRVGVGASYFVVDQIVTTRRRGENRIAEGDGRGGSRAVLDLVAESEIVNRSAIVTACASSACTRRDGVGREGAAGDADRAVEIEDRPALTTAAVVSALRGISCQRGVNEGERAAMIENRPAHAEAATTTTALVAAATAAEAAATATATAATAEAAATTGIVRTATATHAATAAGTAAAAGTATRTVVATIAYVAGPGGVRATIACAAAAQPPHSTAAACIQASIARPEAATAAVDVVGAGATAALAQGSTAKAAAIIALCILPHPAAAEAAAATAAGCAVLIERHTFQGEIALVENRAARAHPAAAAVAALLFAVFERQVLQLQFPGGQSFLRHRVIRQAARHIQKPQPRRRRRIQYRAVAFYRDVAGNRRQRVRPVFPVVRRAESINPAAQHDGIGAGIGHFIVGRIDGRDQPSRITRRNVDRREHWRSDRNRAGVGYGIFWAATGRAATGIRERPTSGLRAPTGEANG